MVQIEQREFRVVTYSRVSTPRQAKEGQSLEAQPESLGRYAKARGWQVVGELSDSGKTGRNAEREGFAAMVRTLHRIKPDAVVATRLSRFMRNARLTLNVVHEMREMGIALICTDEPIDTRQRGVADLILAILATMAEWESERLSEYSKETRRRLISKGRLPSGRPPFGYIYDKKQGELRVDEVKAEVVRLVYRLYAEQRIGMHAIPRELAARAISSPSGNGVWNSNTIRKMLVNATYVGEHPLGVAAPPIIDQETFDRAQQLRKANTKLHPPRKDPWPLQGRLKCYNCGRILKCEYGGGHRYYRCPSRQSSSKYYMETGEKCPLPGVRADELELRLLDAVCNAMFNPQNFACALERSINELKAKAKELERDAAPLEKALREVEQELLRIERAWVRGRLGDGELDTLEREAQDRRDALQAQLDALDTEGLDELEKTRSLIQAAEDTLKMANAQGGDAWDMGVAPPTWFTEVLVPPGWNEKQATAPEDSSTNESYDSVPPSDPDRDSRALNEALNRLQAEVWAKPDGFEIRGAIMLNVPDPSPTPIPGAMRRVSGSAENSGHALTSPSTGSGRTGGRTGWSCRMRLPWAHQI